MPSLSGTVTSKGYDVLASIQVGTAGYGLVVYPSPPLPENPYMGFTFPIIESVEPNIFLAGQGRKMFRDGAIVFVPFPGNVWDIVAIWSSSAVGKDWTLQY